MKIYKINYVKRWGTDGTCYHQTIKIDNELKEAFNIYLMGLKQQADKNYFKNRSYSEYDLKIKGLDYLNNGINYTNLIHLGVFNQLVKYLNDSPLINEKIDTKRIIQNNTIIEVL